MALTVGEQLLELAKDIDHHASKRQGANTYSCQVPWTLIHRLREILADYDVAR